VDLAVPRLSRYDLLEKYDEFIARTPHRRFAEDGARLR
jgi:hypothetical protein